MPYPKKLTELGLEVFFISDRTSGSEYGPQPVAVYANGSPLGLLKDISLKVDSDGYLVLTLSQTLIGPRVHSMTGTDFDKMMKKRASAPPAKWKPLKR